MQMPSTARSSGRKPFAVSRAQELTQEKNLHNVRKLLFPNMTLISAILSLLLPTISARRILSSERLRYCHRHRSHTFREAVATRLNRNRE